jgi:hypothetical protein
MIRYSLSCSNGHEFESWFPSASGYDDLCTKGLVACPECGSAQVEKALMAPRVAQMEPKARLQGEATEREKALAELRRKVEENSEYVGMNFVAEARAMHEGDKPERSIHGEARADEALKLLEDGIPVAPLPFMPKNKAN